MNSQTQDALARLRSADPALDDMPAPRPVSVRTQTRHRFAFSAAAVAAAVAVVSAVGVVWTPGGGGHQSAAWAVGPAPGGAVSVRIRTSDFTNATGVNKELQRQSARAVVMLQSAPGACRRVVPSSINLEQAPARLPWTYSEDKAKVVTIVIHPGRIPAGDVALLVLAQPAKFVNKDPHPSTSWRFVASRYIAILAVRHIPSCVPNLNFDGVVGPHGITLQK